MAHDQQTYRTSLPEHRGMERAVEAWLPFQAAEEAAERFYEDNPEPELFPLLVDVVDAAGERTRWLVDLDYQPTFDASAAPDIEPEA